MRHIVCVWGIVGALGASGCMFGLPDDPFNRDGSRTDSAGEVGRTETPSSTSSTTTASYEPYDGARYDDGSLRHVELANASMRGQIGDIQGFDAPATDAFAEENGPTTSVELHIEDPSIGGWVMARLDLAGIPGEEPQVAGGSFELTSAVYTEESTGDSEVVEGGLGCAGPTRGDWDYDAPIAQVSLEITESPNPNHIRLVFESDFDDGYSEGDHFVTAELDYPLAR